MERRFKYISNCPWGSCCYDRNTITNKAPEEAGVKLNYIPGSELVRGRGGPRCMSMPLYREDL